MDSDLQRGYQPAMIVGQVVVAGFAALLAVWVRFSNPTTSMQQTHVSARNRELVQRGNGYAGGYNNQRENAFHGGLINRGRLHIIPDGPVVTPQVTPASFTFHADIGPTSFSAPSVGRGTGSGVGFGSEDSGLPEAPSLISLAPRPPAVPDYSVQRDIQFHEPDQPLGIWDFSIPALPVYSWHVHGSAKALIKVNERGRLTSVIIEDEQPKNLGLGAALREALDNCNYEPAIVDGQKVAMEVSITFFFSLDSSSFVRTTGNVKLCLR